MESLYAEAGVHKGTSTFGYFIKVLCITILILLTVSSVSALVKVGDLALILPILPFIVAICGIMYVVFPKLNLDYEYIYCEDRLDFDRIRGKATRKNMLRIEMETVDLVAPITSSKLEQYKDLPIKDFSSKKEDDKYVIVTTVKEKKTKILFEPSERMVECMYMKAPRKVEKK